MASRILLVFSAICSSVAVHLHKECEASSTLEIAYGWSTTDISVWVPSEDSPFLTIEIELEGYNFPKYYDLIKVSRSNISVEFIRERNFQTKTNNMNQMISPGWADITMSLELNYGLTYHNHNMVLPINSSVEFFPKLIRLKGSNVTINCPIGQRMWKISDKPVYVPFENSEPQSFYTFYVREFLPVMFIESRKVTLGWDEGTYTTIESKAKQLPAFEKHNLVISCLNERDYICIVKVGSTRIMEEEEVKVGNVLRSISFRSDLGSTYYLIHQSSRSVSPDLETATEQECIHPSTFSSTDTWKDIVYIVTIVILLALLIIMIMLGCFRKGPNENVGDKDLKKPKGQVQFSRKSKEKGKESDVERGPLLNPDDNPKQVAAQLQRSTGGNKSARKRNRKSKSDPSGMFSKKTSNSTG